MNNLVPGQIEVDNLMAAAVRSLAADGITPEHVLSWDPSGAERSIKALAAELDAYLSRAAIPDGPA